MATLIVLNYASGLVKIVEDISDNWTTEETEDYIQGSLEMSVKNVNYMITYEENPIEYI